MTSAEVASSEHDLAPKHELRLEVGWENSVTLTLKRGEAEVFGTALVLGDTLTLTGQKIAVFTWEGCKLAITGQPDILYTSEDTPMQSYVNVHDVLEARRQQALTEQRRGPTTVIVGPTDAGKSTLCKILINYAIRCRWTPALVDLDIGQGSITVPGCIAATSVEAPIDVEEGFPVDAPLVYYAGTVAGGENMALYQHLVERVADALERRAGTDAKVAASGMMVNTMGWIEGDGYSLLRHTIASLAADVVLVVGSDRLHSQLSSDLATSSPAISVVKLAKSGGVVTRTRELRQEARKVRVEEYFYGPTRSLAPASQTLKLEGVEVYRVGGGPKAPPSALPIGATSVADPLKLARVTNPQELLYTVLGVSHAPTPDLLLSASVAGFVYVQDVDLAKGSMSVLAPRPGPLPGSLLLAGNFKVYLD
uniref:Protein CLP1 homolog n=1 Tax=Auxenochlorella protothecoides TaxID=3075 RepID=A0A1D2A6U4_AUXPR